jgi:tRNA 2-thiocytidine biosynthesis protein TtcA
MSYWIKEIRSQMGRAIHRYGMIADGDRILVAVSGGKDSLSLLHLLFERKRRVPIRYELIPVHIDLGFGEGHTDHLRSHFEGKGLTYHVERTEIGKRAHGPENRENPCFLCAWERRKRIFELAKAYDCNKVALGHHKDDIVETLLLNMLYTGEFSTMLPIQPLFKGKLTLIRPLALIDEKQIARFARELALPVGSSACPSCGGTKRQEMKELVHALEKKNPRAKANLFRCLSNVKMEYTLMGPVKAETGQGDPAPKP